MKRTAEKPSVLHLFDSRPFHGLRLWLDLPRSSELLGYFQVFANAEETGLFGPGSLDLCIAWRFPVGSAMRRLVYAGSIQRE